LGKTDPNKEVTFRTNYGTFVNGKTSTDGKETKITSSGRTATTKLQVTQEVKNKIFINAFVGTPLVNYASEIELKTIPSYPTTFDINPDNLRINKNGGNIVTMNIKTQSSKGKVSENIPVHFSYSDVDKKGLVLNFVKTASIKDENASVQLKSLNDSIGKFAFRIAIPKNSRGDSLVQFITMDIQ
jgi:hypothetical protein